MKTIRSNIDKWFERLEGRWRALPLYKQQRYTLFIFGAYLLLTAGVIFKVFYDTASSEQSMNIEHIKNPVFKKKESPEFLQDTLVTILKDKIYERR
ncbi:hypothetical protein EV144_106362 [Flavobacterium sp. 270]|uniref:nitrogen regulatory IIA protein n=1 Tax=Flavobacterium sp. 270 TaxID=2512114 RepID=UPI0010647B76|nr:nitrogen regulatory IIA protein [Flavobacterium sp. 270]TDW46688.1 hypothetical protein EV144_106362 [Flavobacterium sp. 270]